MDTYKQKIEKLDKEFDGIFEELQNIWKKLFFKSMIYRDSWMGMNRELLEKSLSKEMREKLNEKE